MNNVFFTSGAGLTSTSANFYANIAQELIQSSNERLNSVRFFETSVSSISSDVKQVMSNGISDLSFITDCLKMASSMNAFCAWVREAIKEKDAMLMRINSLSREDWAKQNNIEWPKSVTYPDLYKTYTEADIIAGMDIDKLNKYLSLEAFAATFGKYIHPKGPFSSARKEATEAANNPITKEGSGRDLILYTRKPTVNICTIDEKFLQLQNIYRGYEQELNQMKAEIKAAVTAANIKSNSEYLVRMDEYKSQTEKNNIVMANITSQYNNWKSSEQERISKLKIVIPSELEGTFNIIKEYNKE